MRAELRERLQDRLNDPQLTQVEAGVSHDDVRQLHAGLLRLPEPVLEKFLNKNTQIVIGSQSFCKQATNSPDLGDALGWFKAGKKKGGPWLYPGKSPDYEPNQIAVVNNGNTIDMITTLIHEVGHDLDYDQRERNFTSRLSHSYTSAVEDYMVMRSGQTHKTERYFKGERSFAKEHITSASYKGKPDAVTIEHAAEMLCKYTERAHQFDRASNQPSRNAAFLKSDRLMSDDYGATWDIYKRNICPEIGQHVNDLQKQAAKENKKEAFSDFTTATDRSFFAEVASATKEGLRSIRDRMFGEKEPVRWTLEEGGPHGSFYAYEITEQSRRDIRKLTDELKRSNIDYTINSNEKGNKRAIIVSDLLSMKQLRNHGRPSSQSQSRAAMSALIT